MSDPEKHERPFSQAERDYRSQVEQLVQTCVDRIRHYELPDEAEPPAANWPCHD